MALNSLFGADVLLSNYSLTLTSTMRMATWKIIILTTTTQSEYASQLGLEYFYIAQLYMVHTAQWSMSSEIRMHGTVSDIPHVRLRQ